MCWLCVLTLISIAGIISVATLTQELFLLKLLAVCLSAFEYTGLAIVCLAVVPLLAPVRFVRQAYDDIQM